jgi:HAD superfamily hydrolase (TIGR01549 family)
MPIKAVIFDYVGTLVNCGNYSIVASREKLYFALKAEGFDVDREKFLAAYIVAHEKYHKVRYEQLREVTNAIWVVDALCSLGFKVGADDEHVKAALNVFFQDYIDTLELREGAKQLLREISKQFKVGLISNFTYAPVIYKSLRKTGINQYFNAVVISEETGWRKPSNRIFLTCISRLLVQASEAFYIGDSPIEDIKGAAQAGIKTVFVPSQFNTLKDLNDSKQKPDCTAKDLTEIQQILTQILSQP